MKIRTVCVYCASSRQADPEYRDAAAKLGAILAQEGASIVFGGGAIGSMGVLADAALSAGGKVVGIIPKFMYDLEWAHPGLTELRLVDDMHARKKMMIQDVDAIIALPGGCGTMEELMEAITWKRLGLYFNPIILLNTRQFFDPLLQQLDRAIQERFMDERHRTMWSVVEQPGTGLGRHSIRSKMECFRSKLRRSITELSARSLRAIFHPLGWRSSVGRAADL